MSAQTWNAEGYAKNARFVTDLGAPVFELLAPQPGESILDVGCGDGVLTKKIAEVGCRVIGLDSSREFCVAARSLGIDVVELSASDMTFAGEFDAVFKQRRIALDERRWSSRGECGPSSAPGRAIRGGNGWAPVC